MAYTTGTATDYHDLLDKLRIYATANGWTQERWTPPPSGLNSYAELWLRGPGTGAGRRVYVGIRTTAIPASNIFSWDLTGSVGFDSAQTYAMQPSVGSPVYLNLWTSTITYWFYVNDRRIIVVAKVSTNYMSAYLGHALPMTLPTEYPHPLVIIGNYYAPEIPGVNNSGNRMLADPALGAIIMRDRGGTWRYPTNHDRTANQNYTMFNPVINGYHTWPWRVAGNNTYSNEFRFRIRQNNNDESLLIQTHLVGSNLREGMALEGVFWLPGFGRASEQVVTAGARSFKLFQNVFRSTEVDFMAIEEA